MGEDPTATKLLTAEQLAKRLKVSREWVYRLARDQEIPAFRVEEAYRFDWGEILGGGHRPGIRLPVWTETVPIVGTQVVRT